MPNCSDLEQRLAELLRGRKDALAECAALDDPLERKRCRSHVLGDIERAREDLAACEQRDLTGTWVADDGGLYFIRQIADAVWWAALSAESTLGGGDFQLGLASCNVFFGTRNGDRVQGEWVDVPRGANRFAGTSDLVVAREGLRTRAATGGFGASSWSRAAYQTGPDIRSRFDRVYRNDGDTMHEHLKMYKDDVVMFGRTVTPLGASYQPGADARYDNFMCNQDRTFDDEHFDGDVFFWMVLARDKLESQSGFWQDDWFNDPLQIWYKLANSNPDGDNPALHGLLDLVHPEIVMYGRPAGKDRCDGSAAPLLPGWMETGPNSVLWNGAPVNGRVDIMAGQPVRVLGDSVQPGTAVRVSGFLALDCHGAFGDCAEDNHNDNNVELHPVYAVDVLRDPGVSPTELTGVWHCSDVGTYYVRQIGQTVWWLGMSRDRGHTFANVFRGTLQGAALSGSWADVPLSSARSAGVLALDARSGASATALHRMSATGGFGGATWEKIRD